MAAGEERAACAAGCQLVAVNGRARPRMHAFAASMVALPPTLCVLCCIPHGGHQGMWPTRQLAILTAKSAITDHKAGSRARAQQLLSGLDRLSFHSWFGAAIFLVFLGQYAPFTQLPCIVSRFVGHCRHQDFERFWPSALSSASGLRLASRTILGD